MPRPRHETRSEPAASTSSWDSGSTSLAVATTAIDAWQHGFPTAVVSDLTVAHAWGGHTVEENQKWSLDYIAAMAKSKIVRSDELMK